MPSAVTLDDRHAHEVAHGRKIAENAEEVWGWSKPTGPERLKRRTEFIIEGAGLRPGKHALEIGCGTGLITEYFSASGADITGIDISPDLLTTAESRTFQSSVDFRLGNVEALDFEDASFDAVVGSSVLHHLDIGKALDEMCRVLKPGGRLAFSEPNMLNPHIFVQKNVPWVKRLAGDSPDETAFVRWKFARQLRSAGFRSIEITPYDFLHPAVPSAAIGAVSWFGRHIERLPIAREIAGSLIIRGRKP